MANFQRLIRLSLYFVVGILLGGVSALSFAETIPATVTAKVCSAGQSYKFVANGHDYCSSTAICMGELGVGVYSGAVGYVMCNTSPTPTRINYTTPSDVPGYTCPANQGWTLTGTQCVRPDCPVGTTRDSYGVCQCPSGQSLQGGVCKTTCPTGYHNLVPDNGQCEKDCIGDQTQDSSGKCVCAIGSSKEWISFSGGYDATTGCANGCQYNLGGMAIGNAITKTYYTRGQRNGSICGSNTNLTPAPKLVDKTPLPPADTSGTSKDGATPDPKNTLKNAGDPEACAGAGGSYGSYNGVGKCLTPDANTPQITSKPSKSSTVNSDGSKSETVTDETTTCTGSSCTTGKTSTTTTTGADGTVKSSTTTGTGAGSSGTGNGDGKSDFCADHPNSIICTTSSWSGDCDQPPVCDGDAVACAVAKGVWEHRCVNKWAEKENQLSGEVDQTNLFGDKAKADAALNKDGAHDWDVLAKFQEKRQNYLTFSSSCSPNLGFDFKGVHYDFDTSILCQIGLVVKILLHLAAYLALIRLLTVKLF